MGLGVRVPRGTRSEVPVHDLSLLPPEGVGEDLVQHLQRYPGEEGDRSHSRTVLENRLARVLAGDLEGRHRQRGHSRRKVARRDRELLRVEDDEAPRADPRCVHIDRSSVEGVEDVEPVALGVRAGCRSTGQVVDVTSPDNRLVGVHPKDVQAEAREAARDRLTDGSDAVPRLTADTNREVRHPAIRGCVCINRFAGWGTRGRF